MITLSTKMKLKQSQPPSTTPDNKKSSPLSSKKKLIINLKDAPNTQPSPKQSSHTSPKSRESRMSPPTRSPKNSEKTRKSNIHTQRLDRSRTLKVVFRRPSEAIVQNLQSIGPQSQVQRNYSIDFDLNDTKSPLKLIPKTLILYEESKKMLKKVLLSSLNP